MNVVFGPEDLKTLPIAVDPEVMSGSPCFRGTRVPIDALWNNLATGMSLNEFLENFPTVRREDAIQLLQFANRSLLALAYAA